jgi:hydrophobic/amphiphilic exporter-1 (mainly G- bacteria), HAE1 family
MASAQLLPTDVAVAVLRSLESYGGGAITTDSGSIAVNIPRLAVDLEDFKQIQVPAPGGRSVALRDIAHLDLTVPMDSTRVVKTSGNPSVILFVSPKPGGNIKAMAEETKRIVTETLVSLPKDIEYKILVDPSEFIRSSVNNVGREVALAAGLAVFVLFMFVGNLRNVATAAVEIPLSIILAFILMRISGMNLNLISLGGLALSAGMNVDASVVVMENIFRHFEEVGGRILSYEERLELIVHAVAEVRFSVIASTIASLVVFLPLAFTSELSYAILGDLAKAVVFSHGFSAIVALILVPTIRLHIMKNGMAHDKPSVLERPLQKLENLYVSALSGFMKRQSLRLAFLVGLVVAFALLVTLVAPRLPREIIGKPETDWLVFGVQTSGNTLVRQMEAQAEQIENEVLKNFGDQILYTFTQIGRANNCYMMLRLKDKSKMKILWKGLEEKFPNTPFTSYFIQDWNPAELPLPNPPDFQVTIRGSDRNAMAETSRDLGNEIKERKIFNRLSSDPNVSLDESLRIRPRTEFWPSLGALGVHISQADIAALARTAITGRNIGRINIGNETMEIFMRYPDDYVKTPEELAALPIGIGSHILPFKALAEMTMEPSQPAIRREDGRDAFLLSARGEKDEEKKTKESVRKATDVVKSWPKIQAEQIAAGKLSAKKPGESQTTIQIDDPQKELNDALRQLVTAVSMSVGLIFLTMVFQFGSIMNALLVLVSVPLGFIGVLISLWVFHSTVSLNSMLGVILLNGLAVANSIILVDFLQRKVKEGVAPRQAALEVARVRLRPILMTSLTTGLGMLPIALGFGEGGKILQPLGIAVAGGLGFSMITTLFIVPSLQVNWLEWCARREIVSEQAGGKRVDHV